MPQITAQVTGTSAIAASILEAAIGVDAGGETTVGVNVGGGVGPAGSTNIGEAEDVSLNGLQDGDVLRYSVGRWRNYAEENLTDGGNF